MADNKQSVAYHETLPDAGVLVLGNVHIVLDPGGTGTYRLATSGADGLGEAWIVADGFGVRHLDSAPAGADPIAYFASANVVLL